MIVFNQDFGQLSVVFLYLFADWVGNVGLLQEYIAAVTLVLEDTPQGAFRPFTTLGVGFDVIGVEGFGDGSNALS